MNLLIMGLFDARDYQPNNSTYAIQIQSSLIDFQFNLKKSSLYTIVNYIFDDNWPGKRDKVTDRSTKTFDKNIAHNIITNFQKKGLDKRTLLVHCYNGISRPPAVAMVLNDIFDLGHDGDKLKKRYNGYNRYVYNLLLEVAEDL